MICANCGTENRAGRKFCLECGNALPAGCPNCGAENEPNARFCGNCGTSLGAAPTAQPVAARPVASAATAPVAVPATQRRFVTVMFADLVGFTPFAEERDAEDVRDTLERYGSIASDVVSRYGGTVEKFIGDAVMAVWGTPTAHEDDAERAVRAALELTDAVRTLGAQIEARAGVLTGEAAVNVGATDQNLLAGDLVNTAARLQSAAPPSAVLVGESTMRATSAAVAYERAGDQTLKGKALPVAAWRALRIVAQRGGAGRSDTIETPFVGRDEEMRLLKDQLHLTGRDPRTRLVSVTGPAGIGKSRLAWELEKYLDGIVETVFWHRGRSPSYGEGVTFWALGEMVRSRARLPENANEQETRAGIHEAVARYVTDESEREWIESSLLALLGVGDAMTSGRELLFAAWRRFFENIAATGTTVLVFEDVHWADTGLLDFIDHLLDWSKSAPLLIITLARPELFDRRPNWGAGRRTFTAVALDPLPEAQMRKMLATVVPDLPEQALRSIIQRADGIPLYAVETIRMLLSDGRLTQVDGVYQPTRELGDLEVPETLRSLIAARLDGLDAADRRLLQDAAVLGQAFSLDSLAAVAAGDETTLTDRLRALVRKELLTVEVDPRSPERGQYGFVQSLIREVAYSTLARAERRDRHLAAARHLEATGGDELAGALAGHYVAAHAASAPGPEADAVAAQARIALRGAAERAAALAGHKQAVAFLEQALQLTTDDVDRAGTLERLAEELATEGRYAESEARTRAALELVGNDGEQATRARLRGLLGRALVDQGLVSEAIKELEQTLTELPSDVEPQIRADVLAKLGRAYYRGLQWQKALEIAEQALTLAERHRLLLTLGEAMVTKATALQMAARPIEALSLFKAGLAIAKREGDLDSVFRAQANMGGLLAFEESAKAAGAVTLDALATARAMGNLGQTVWHVGNLLLGSVFGGGPLDTVLAQADELLALDLDRSDRHHLLAGYLGSGSMYGLDVRAMEEEFETTIDPQQRAGLDFSRWFANIARGDWIEASERAERTTRSRPQLAMMPNAAIAAGLGGDTERMRRLIEAGREMPVIGRLGAAMVAAAESLLLAVDGRTAEAIVGLRDPLRIIEEMSAELHYGIVALAMLHLLGPVPEATAAGQLALANFERNKNHAMAGHLRAALGSAAQAESVQGEAPVGTPA